MGRVAVYLLITALIGPSLQAQRSGTRGGGGGAGPVSPAVFATWEGSSNTLDGMNLDLLVLWRGTSGWVDERDLVVGGPGTEMFSRAAAHIHRVTTRGRKFELQFDPEMKIARVQGQVIMLNDANVILLDEVDSPGGIKIAGTLRIDPKLPQDGSEPVGVLIRRSSALLQFAQVPQ